jgi:hypothetical protein
MALLSHGLPAIPVQRWDRSTLHAGIGSSRVSLIPLPALANSRRQPAAGREAGVHACRSSCCTKHTKLDPRGTTTGLVVCLWYDGRRMVPSAPEPVPLRSLSNQILTSPQPECKRFSRYLCTNGNPYRGQGSPQFWGIWVIHGPTGADSLTIVALTPCSIGATMPGQRFAAVVLAKP